MRGLAAALTVGLASCGGSSQEGSSPPPDDRAEGPYQASGQCPTFKSRYPTCEVTFGNEGLSTLNSFYETFVGEGAFEISESRINTAGPGAYTIVAQSNRGPIATQVLADRVVRLGQDRENERLTLTHEAAYCDAGRVYQNQVGYPNGDVNVQDLEFWTQDDTFNFVLYQNGRKTAEVQCR